MRYYSIFSGVEAATLAWEPLGWEPLVFSEIDEFPSAVLRYRYPNVPNLGDITKIDWREAVRAFGRPDVVVGGSPCQSFSIAGDRTGLDGASGLMWEYVRAVRELMPRWLLWENVPGALSSSNGEDFRCLLEALDACGYGLAWRVLDAELFGVAQRRERVFVVGRLGDVEGPCEVLFEPESLSWDTPSSREKRKELAAGAGGGAVCAGFKWHQGSGAGSIGLEDEQSPTLTADYHNPAVLDLTGGEAQASRVYSSDGIAPSLRAHESGGNDLKVLCMTDTQPHAMVDGEVCVALSATMHKDPPVVAKTLKIRGGCEGGGKGPLVQEDVSATLGTSNDQTLFQPIAFEGKQVSGVCEGYEVRKLTPRECERIMGMPDDWTKIPYRGKSADECPDGPRYRAIGNSMAVSVMKWIGVRIDAVERGIETDEACSRIRGEIFGNK